MNDLLELVNDCKPLDMPAPAKLHALERMKELQELGLEWVAARMRDKILLQEKLECVAKEKFPVITVAKIKAFLEKKAAQYNEGVVKKHGKPKLTGYTQSVTFGASSFGINAAFNALSDGLSSGSVIRYDEPANDWIRTSDVAFAPDDSFTVPTNDFLSPSADRVSGFRWTEVPLKDYQAIPPDYVLQVLRKTQAKEIFDEFTIASVNQVKDPLLLGRLKGCEDRFYLAQWGDDIALDDVL